MQSNTSQYVLLDGLDSTAHYYLLPTGFLWAYFGVVVAGGFFTNAVLAGYLARRRHFPAVLHLCLADIASLLFLAPYEILVLSDHTGAWAFPRECCMVFMGLEVLLGTATIYILIVINFSSALGNQKTSMKIPLLTIWLLSISLSAPDFIFAEVISPRLGYKICCLPKRASFLIGAFRLSLPVFLLFIGTVIVIFVLFKADQPKSLCLALVLSLTYIAVSVQRSVLGVLYEVVFPSPGPDSFRTPPLADVIHNPVGTLTLALVHYTLSAARPLISWSVTPEMRAIPETDNVNNEAVA